MQKKDKINRKHYIYAVVAGSNHVFAVKRSGSSGDPTTAAGGIGKHDIICCVVCGHVFDLGIHVLDRYIALAWRAYAFFSVAAVFFLSAFCLMH